jgi:tRNA (adenine22-N1)-methyltransferase
VIVDVGADHGHVAHEVGAIATEAAPGRMGRRDLPWVVADGLTPFRNVDIAIVAGMGARTIARILAAGPRPSRAVVAHAQDDPPALRVWLAANGWRIDAEVLAPEAGRFAEVVRAVPGVEPATGLHLAFGPRLLAGDDPHLGAHLRHLRDHHLRLAEAMAPSDPERAAEERAKAAFLWDTMAGRTLRET